MARTTRSKPPHNVKTNEKADDLKNQFRNSHDLICNVQHTETESFEIIYFESLIEINYLDQYILPKLGLQTDCPVINKLKSFFQAEDVTLKSIDDLSNLLFEGKVLFIIKDVILSIQAGNFPKRIPEESALETSIRGPKDGSCRGYKDKYIPYQKKVE